MIEMTSGRAVVVAALVVLMVPLLGRALAADATVTDGDTIKLDGTTYRL
jgi:hypothetical protein